MFPAWIVAQYDLLHMVVKGHIYLEMQQAVWGLSQAGDSSKQVAVQKTHASWILRMQQMPGLWNHATRHILFTLVVYNFGVKCVNKEDVNHLIKCLKKKFELTKDWDGNRYCGIS
jgi:hypothetical protein